jgi:hypothetical protein
MFFGDREMLCRLWFSEVAIGWSVVTGIIMAATTAQATDPTRDDKQALAGVQGYVGEWRGVGQPKRGSNQGAWTEQAAWAWRFDDQRAELVAELTGNKYFSRLRLQPGEAPGQFVLLATPAGDAPTDKAMPSLRLCGGKSDGAMVFTADEPSDKGPARISLRLVAGGDRLLVLYEKRQNGGSYARLAEVGSTRKGSLFARAGANGPECIVTGGLGTIAVEHEGKKYYVCCGGCRDYFLENPAGVLAEYRERKAEEKKNAEISR